MMDIRKTLAMKCLTIRTSLDGVSWTAQTSGSSHLLSGVAFGAGRFVAGVFNGTILVSP